MAIKYIPQEWKDQLAGGSSDYSSLFDFYINPRGRVFPSLTSTGVTYVKNGPTVRENMKGTYRLQTTASNSLTYVYTMSQRFIVEGWFKPDFEYNVASNQTIFQCGDAAEFSIIYNATTDKFDMIQSPGTTISSSQFTATGSLATWFYLRAWYDNIGKLAGFYLWRNTDEIFCNTQNVPGAGAFVPLNTISFFPSVALQSSYWIIHELDDTLTTGQYKTYQADRQTIFDFNGTTLGRERIRIPRTRDSTDLRGVKDFTITKTGSGKANTANLNLYNFFGQWSDDQYDAFNPFQGYYNGPQKYLQNRVGVEIESHYITTRAPLYPSDTLYPALNLYPSGPLGTSCVETVFIGRTTPGAFSRNSPNWQESMVSVDAEDGISELGETKLSRSYAYDSLVGYTGSPPATAYDYHLCDPTQESLSLVHLITRLVTKHEIRNYALNSSFENATIGNSWLASGLTLTRDATPQFGTYGAKAIATTGQYFRQTVKFETVDFIDQGEIFNFSAFVRQGTASTVKLQIEELDNTGTLIGSATETACGTDTGVFTRVNVARTILSPLCTQLRITFYAVGNSTFYVDGVMLTRGIDPVDYFVLNANDGASGIGSAESYASYLYDTKAIDTAVSALSHPYAIVNKGDTAWDHLKDINEALIPRYVGETCDGVLKFDFAYNEIDPAIIGAIEDVASIQTSLDINQENSIKVEGIIIDKTEKNTPPIAQGIKGATLNSGNALLHPISSGANLEINGTDNIEVMYDTKE
jgi:hypothetical protein